jgi:hypothetical protein
VTIPSNTPEYDARLRYLADLAVTEMEALRPLLESALAVQWDRGPRPEREVEIKAQGGRSDPTSDVAVDPGRLHVRRTLVRAEPYLADAVTRLRGVRRGLERALDHWEGVPSGEVQSADPK